MTLPLNALAGDLKPYVEHRERVPELAFVRRRRLGLGRDLLQQDPGPRRLGEHLGQLLLARDHPPQGGLQVLPRQGRGRRRVSLGPDADADAGGGGGRTVRGVVRADAHSSDADEDDVVEPKEPLLPSSFDLVLFVTFLKEEEPKNGTLSFMARDGTCDLVGERWN